MIDPAAQSAMLDILNDLFDLELNSVFHSLGDNAPYLNRTTASIRRPLAEMITASHRRAAELSKLIDNLGGIPIPRGLQAAEQDIAYLSMEFLLPRLVGAKEIAIARWQAAKTMLGNRSPKATALLDAQLIEHRLHLSFLQKAVGRQIDEKQVET